MFPVSSTLPGPPRRASLVPWVTCHDAEVSDSEIRKVKQGAAACTAGDLGDEFFVIEPLGRYGDAGGGRSKGIGWLRVVK